MLQIIHLTYIHTIAICFCFLIFILLLMATFKQKDKRIFWTMLIMSFVGTFIMIGFFMIVIDRYTKKAHIENLHVKRILRNESIAFSGIIRNTGGFKIKRCTYEIKLINNPSLGSVNSSNVFLPSGANSSNEDKKTSIVYKKFIIAKDLEADEFRYFSLSMPYPPYFSRASSYQKLNCH